MDAYCPTFIHRALRWSSTWQRAAEKAGLPGSSIRVLRFLEGRAARGDHGLSRHSIARRSGIPLSTVRDGVKSLLGVGWIQDSPRGLVIVLKPKSGATVYCEKGGRISPPGKMSEAGTKMAPHAPAAAPPGAMPSGEGLSEEQGQIVTALEMVGCDRRGAVSAARSSKVGPSKVKELLENLTDLHAAGQVSNLQAAAVWALKSGPRAVRSWGRQAGRMRGEQARRGPVVRPPDPADRAAFMAGMAELQRKVRAAARETWRSTPAAVRRCWAHEFRLTMDRDRVQDPGSRAMFAGILLESRLGLRS